MAHFDCGWTCGCAGTTVRPLENTCLSASEGDDSRRGAISSVRTFTLTAICTMQSNYVTVLTKEAVIYYQNFKCNEKSSNYRQILPVVQKLQSLCTCLWSSDNFAKSCRPNAYFFTGWLLYAMVKYLNTLRRYLNTSISIWVFKWYLNTDINCSIWRSI